MKEFLSVSKFNLSTYFSSETDINIRIGHTTLKEGFKRTAGLKAASRKEEILDRPETG